MKWNKKCESCVSYLKTEYEGVANCDNCRRNGYFLYIHKDGYVDRRNNGFADTNHHDNIRCSSGMTFGW